MLSSQRFILVVVLLLIFIMAARTPLDSDMWWHLRAGEETLRMGHPMTVDTLSHTRYGERWVNHSWLSQVVLYLLYQTGSFFALGAFVAILAVLSCWLVYLQMEGNVLLRAFILVLMVMVAALVWSPRPQMVSLVMFGFTGYLLYLFKWRQSDYLWVLVPLFIFWSNLHGGYALGLILIAAMTVGEMVNHVFFREGREVLTWKRIGKLALWGVAAWLVVVLNPNGLAMWLIPFQTVGVSVLQEFISEWASPDFHQLVQQPFIWLLLATLGTAGLSQRRLDGTDLVSMALFATMALVARRNFGPFAMVATPVLSRHLWVLLEEWWRQAEVHLGDSFSEFLVRLKHWGQGSLSTRTNKIVNTLVVVLLASVAIFKLYAVTELNLVERYMADYYPLNAVAWIKENKPDGELFNEYNWGGYLTWELRDYPVFVDGRTDLYGDELLREYLDIQSGGSRWKENLERYGIGVVLVDANSGLARSQYYHEGWRRAYEDEQAVVLLRVDNE